MPKKAKRIVILSDLHCGHRTGLTPPDWQDEIKTDSHTQRNKFAILQRAIWEFYIDTLKELKPIDVLFVNGDAIDGIGNRSGGTELITTDRSEQVDIAAECIKQVGARKIIMTYGTAYHTGEAEDWELHVSLAVKAEKIGSHEWINVNGLIFDLKHHIGSSSIPHGRHTAIAKDRFWNQLWSINEEQPMADVIIRSHVHYHSFCGGPNWLAMTTPAMQAYGTKFGARRCSGKIDVGLLSFDIDKDGDYAWESHIAGILELKTETLDL